jgi:fatty acid desaturase
LIAISILAMNHFRTLAAHRYQSDGDAMSFADQFFDSTIITGGPVLTELLCPLGLRYHALHHLFPTLPYHNLGIAHRRLMRQLPADSPYRSIVYPSVWSVLRELFQSLPAARQELSSGSQRWYALRSEHLQRGPVRKPRSDRSQPRTDNADGGVSNPRQPRSVHLSKQRQS